MRTSGYTPIKDTEQNLQNLSFDQDFKVNAVEGLVYNPDTENLDRMVQPAIKEDLTNGSQITKIQETVPTDDTKNNASTVLSYDGNGDLQYIDETIGTTTYRTTLTYVARVLSGISSAVEL